MLEELALRNVGPIRAAQITPAQGLTAITGETGAGKSMLLSAIRLISGGAVESSRVASGADEAWAQGVFSVEYENSQAADIARQAGIEPEDGELFLSRVVPASGRSRAVVGGKTVPRSVLADVSAELVTVHGQADQLRIASPARQRELLDAFASDSEELSAYRTAWEAFTVMDERLERLRSQESSARDRADYLRESIERINRVNPQTGEDEELKARRDRIENAADIAQGVGAALAALDASQVGDDAVSAVDLVNRAVQSLRAIHIGGVFSEQASRLESINADLSDVVSTLATDIDDEASVADLDQINARIHELNELTRRWGPTIADVIAWRDKAAFEVEDLDASPEKVAELEVKREQLYKQALAAAETLSAVRRAAAERLSKQVSDELAALAMAGAALEVRVTERDNGLLNIHGRDNIEFLFTPFPSSPQLPMGKSASGGELSRLMLALELVAASERGNSEGMTFIFDEIDAGVGGKTAVELGRRLATLAQSSQVIVVTHLAQVASWASSQFVVTKSGETTVSEVCGEERVGEIARMLAGSESQTSLEHARELLAESKLS